MLFEPARDERGVIAERQLCFRLAQGPTERRKRGAKNQITLVNFVRAWNQYPRGRGATEEVPNGINRIRNVSVVRRDILTRDIGTKTLVAVLGPVEDEADFSPLSFIAIFFRAQKHSQFQRHVEPW